MTKPAYRIKIGSLTFDSAIDQEIISISIDLDMDVPCDSFQIVLKPVKRADTVEVGDPVAIELGYESALARVLTGSVDELDHKISQLIVRGLCDLSVLTRLRVNQVYQKQTAGSIVKDLAGRGGIPVKVADDGLHFPMYCIDNSKDVHTHMKEMALKCGFDLFLSGDGKLVFKQYARQPAKQFEYGVNIIEAEIHELMPSAACVKIFGESSSSFKGAGTARWISKRAVEGMAGNGSPLVIIEDPLIRDKETADRVAAAMLQSLSTSLSGTLKVLGNAAMGLGETIEVKDMPDSRMNGEFEATSVSHVFSKVEGFVSVIGWRKRGGKP